VNTLTSGGWGELINDFNIQDSNLVGLWHMNDNGNDGSGNGNNGSVSGTIEDVGLWGTSSYLFNGSTSVIDVSDSASLSFGNGSSDNAFSVCAWIFNDDSSITFPIISKQKDPWDGQGEYALWSGSTGLNFAIVDTWFGKDRRRISTKLVPENKWSFVCGTYDGRGGTNANDGMNVYLDGILESSTKANNGVYVAMENTSFDLKIGEFATNFADGKIEETSIWNIELNSENIKQIYDNSKGQWLDENLVAYYKFDENTGTTVYDSARGHDGTLTNGASISDYGMWDSNAGSFDNLNDCVNLSGVISLNETHSFMAWARFDQSYNAAQYMMDSSNSSAQRHILLMNPTDNGHVAYYDGGYNYIPYYVEDTAWHHFALTSQLGGDVNIWVDGTEYVTGGTPRAINTNVTVAGRFNCGTGGLGGSIDEVRYYDDILTSAEIIADYNSFLDSKFVDSTVIDASSSNDWNAIKINSNLYYDFGTQLNVRNELGRRTNQINIENEFWDSDLISVLHLNNNTNDSKGNNNSTWSGTETYTPGLWDNNGINLNGSSYLDLNDDDGALNVCESGGNGAVSLWFKHSNTTQGTTQEIISYNGNGTNAYKWNLTTGFNAGGVDKMGGTFCTTGWSYNCGSGYNDGLWHHAIIQDTGSAVELYIDGELLSCSGGSKEVNEKSIGRGRYSNFTGSVEEVLIFEDSLTNVEINELYESQAGHFHEPSIVGLWHLNGNGNDSSGRENQGIETGTIEYSACLWGTTCFDYGSGNEYYIVDNSNSDFNFTSDFSVSAWVNVDVEGGYIFAKDSAAGGDRGYYLATGVGYYRFFASDAGTNLVHYTVSHEVDDGLWQHIIGVYDSSVPEMRMYVDGSRAYGTQIGTVTSSIHNSNAVTYIGRTTSGAQYNGKLEEVVVWNKALTDEEARNLYRKGTSSLDLNVYTCTTKGDFNYITDANNNTWMSILGLSSRYLGYDVFFKQPTDFTNNNSGFFHTGAFLTDVNIEAGGVATYVNTGYADANFAPGASTFIGITDNNTIPSGGSIDYNVQFDGNGQWFTNPDYNIGFDYNLILRTILTNGTSSPNLLDVNINYEQTS
jgi:hypothetical protein